MKDPSDSPYRIGDTWKFKTLTEILENPPEPMPPWVFHGLVSQGNGTLVSSQPHGMKSYTWLQASMEGALGKPIWGHFPVSRCHKTLYLETEDPGWMVEQRVTAIANGLGITADDARDAGCFTLGMLGPFDLVKAEREIRARLDKIQPDMCVLSTLQGLIVGRDWKEQKDMAAVNSLLVRISAQHCPAVVITHSPQDKKQKRAAGTITQAANYPTILHYDKCTTEQGTFARVHLDSKMGTNDKFRIRLVNTIPNKIRFVWSRDTDKDALEHYLLEHPDESALEVAAQFDCTPRYVQKLRSSSVSVRMSKTNKMANSQNSVRKFWQDTEM